MNPYKKELREEYKKKQRENKDKHAEIEGKKDNIVSTSDKWYPIVYITFVTKVKDLVVTITPFGLSMVPLI